MARLGLLVGIAAVVLALAQIHAVQNGYDLTGTRRFAWTLGFIALLWLAAYGSGLPDVVRGRRRTVATALATTAFGTVGISLAQLLVGDALLPRFVVLGSAVAIAPLCVAAVALSSGGRALAVERDRVFAVASPSEVEILRLELSERAERAAQVVGSIDMRTLIDSHHGQPVMDLVRESRATVVVLDREAQADERVVHQIAAMHESGIRIRTLAMFHEQWLGKLPVSELERVSLMFDIRELHRSVYARLARVFDVSLALAGAIVLAVVTPVVVVGNLVANRGPLLYRQTRVGKNGALFRILKFRTMRPQEDHLSNEWTTEGDPRITPFGRLLRTTHLDELPQVLNVLRGELSVVGPRPEQPQYVEELVEKIPFYDLRHLVRPGLTGWAQVKYGYAGSQSDALEKLQYEFFYLRHQGLALDVRIVFRTVRSVLGRRGR